MEKTAYWNLLDPLHERIRITRDVLLRNGNLISATFSHCLEHAATIRRSSGSITTIKSNRVGGQAFFIIGSCTLAEEEYNREGELIVLAPESPSIRVLDAHYSPSDGLRQTVSDIIVSGDEYPGIFFSCGYDSLIKLWHIQSNGSITNLNSWKGHKDRVHSMAKHVSDLIMASASQDGSVLMWPYQLDRGTSSRPSPLFRSNPRQGIPDLVQWGESKQSENILFSLASYSPAVDKGQVIVWDGVAMQRLATLSPVTGGLSTIASSSNSSLLAVGGGTTSTINDEIKGDGFLRFYDLRTIGNNARANFKIHTEQMDTDCIIFSPDQNCVISCQGYTHSADLKVFDLRMGHRLLHLLRHESKQENLSQDEGAFSSSVIAWAWKSNGTLVTGGADFCIRGWDISLSFPELSEHCLQTDAPISALSLGPNADESILAAGTESGAVFIWSASRAMTSRMKKEMGSHGEGTIFSF